MVKIFDHDHGKNFKFIVIKWSKILTMNKIQIFHNQNIHLTMNMTMGKTPWYQWPWSFLTMIMEMQGQIVKIPTMTIFKIQIFCGKNGSSSTFTGDLEVHYGLILTREGGGAKYLLARSRSIRLF